MAFGFDINKVPLNGTQKTEIQKTAAKKAENVEAKPVTDNKVIGEYGDKLLEQIHPTFVRAAKISEADEAQLKEMYELAGIKNPKMPTVAQYMSIGEHVSVFSKNMDDLKTANNVRDLYSSPKFGVLNNIFDVT